MPPQLCSRTSEPKITHKQFMKQQQRKPSPVEGLATSKELKRPEYGISVDDACFVEVINVDEITLRDASRFLNVGYVRLIAFLRHAGVLQGTRGKHYNFPFQKYVERGYFRDNDDKKHHGRRKTWLTMRGLEFVRRKLAGEVIPGEPVPRENWETWEKEYLGNGQSVEYTAIQNKRWGQLGDLIAAYLEFSALEHVA